MSDDNQIVIPQPFIALFIEPGRTRPGESRAAIAARYELCEDMAQMLTEAASLKLHELGITEDLVLERIHRGLLIEGSVVSPAEAGWVVCRLAELQGWPVPDWAVPDGNSRAG